MGFFTGRIVEKISNQASLDYIRDWLAGHDSTIVGDLPISTETSLKYSAFFGCNRVLAETFASVPIKEYRKRNDDGRDSTNETGLYDLLHNAPNPDMSAFNFYEMSMYQQGIGGNAVAIKRRNVYDEIVQLDPYQWHEVQIEQDRESKKLIYTFPGDAKLSRKDVFHVPGPSLNGVIGMSPLEYAANAVKLGLTYEQFGINFYKNGAVSSGVFRHPGELNDTVYNRLKESIKKEWTGVKNLGTPILTEDGMEFTPLQVKPIDGELLASKKFQVEDVCRFYRVPLHLVMHLDRATNNNIEHQSLEFVMYTMLPHFKRWESCINHQLLTPKQRDAGFYFEFKLDGLLRGDSKSMAEAFAIGRQWGWLSVNDIRRLLNMNPIPNGDIYLQPMNMVEAGTQVGEQYKKIVDEVYKILSESSRN